MFDVEPVGAEKSGIGTVDRLTIYTVVEDYAGYETPFYGQHGISFLIDAAAGSTRRRMLFDTGQSGEAILHNMEEMNLSPKEIDAIFLSHCHYDHTGGLVEILEAVGRRTPVIAHPKIFRRNMVREGDLRHVGIDHTKEELEGYGAEWILEDKPMKLMDGVITTGEIRREDRVDFERAVASGLYTVEGGELVEDEMLDDISLALRTRGGLIIVTGCAHAGIVSITERLERITGSRKVKAVIGGFHLIDAEEERIDETVKRMRELGVDKIFTGHCTGLRAECKFLRAFKGDFEKLHSGKIMRF